VIDVQEQEAEDMQLGEFAAYWKHPESRMRVLNVLGLNISETPLAQEVALPALVREIGWAQTLLPSSRMVKSVEKYVLLSAAHSFTDFHIDFGGSSVWYHVAKGRKIFYVIAPTEDNLKAFEGWSCRKEGGEGGATAVFR